MESALEFEQKTEQSEVQKKPRLSPKTKKILIRLFKILFPILNLAVAGIIIWYAMRTDGISTSEIFSVRLRWEYIIATCMIVILIILLSMWRLQFSMHAMTGRFQPYLCLRMFLIERHYNLLTPFHVGGRAHQLYYMHKHKFKPHEITAIAISHFVMGRIGFQLVTGIILLALMSRLSQLDGGAVVNTAIWGGIALNIVTTVVVILISFNKTIPNKLGMLGVSALHKMKIIKNKEKAKAATMKTLSDYRITVRKLMKKPSAVFGSILFASLTTFLGLIMIAFIYGALFGWSWQVIPILLLGIVLTDYAASTMPIPGGTGAMELFFLSVFATTFGTPQIFVALVLWKIFSYIIPIITGIPVIIYDNVKSFRQNKTENQRVE